MTAARVPDPGELAEDLAEIKRAVEHGARDTRAAIDALSARIEQRFVLKEVYASDQRGLENRVAKVEERHTWVSRTAVTALLLPILVTIVVAVLLAGGAR